jgi:hypothetical protein
MRKYSPWEILADLMNDYLKKHEEVHDEESENYPLCCLCHPMLLSDTLIVIDCVQDRFSKVFEIYSNGEMNIVLVWSGRKWYWKPSEEVLKKYGFELKEVLA